MLRVWGCEHPATEILIVWEEIVCPSNSSGLDTRGRSTQVQVMVSIGLGDSSSTWSVLVWLILVELGGQSEDLDKCSYQPPWPVLVDHVNATW